MSQEPDWKVVLYRALLDEMQVWPEYRNTILTRIIDWQETKNPHHLDEAQLICYQIGSPIPPALQKEMAVAAQLRIEGDPAGTAAQVAKERQNANALMFMLNLYHAGFSIPEASRKAETLFGGKASTWERYYGERMRPEPEARLRKGWERLIPDHAQTWQKIFHAIPDPAEQ